METSRSQSQNGTNNFMQCWNCGSEMRKHVACELICETCGMIRDCSDP